MALSSANAAGRYLDPLEMLRLGPSASNRQPWRVVKEPGREIFHLYLRRSKGYDKLIKAVDLQRLDMGISYTDREWLGTAPCMSAAESVREAGILWLNEDDSRTFLDLRTAERRSSTQDGTFSSELRG